jgi:FkbM family methyltransferase
MTDSLIFSRAEEKGHIGIAVDAILRTAAVDQTALAIDTSQFQGFSDRADTFSLLAGRLVNQTVSAFLAIPTTSADFLVASAAAAIAKAPFGLWLIDEVVDRSLFETDLNAAESIKRATAVFASTPALRNVLVDLFQRKVYVVPSPASGQMHGSLHELLFGTIHNEGRITDRFFEDQFLSDPDAPTQFFDLPVPAFVHPDFAEMFRFCERLKTTGWRPDFVVDIGASSGIWSRLVSEVFPNAQFVLCDPIFSRYRDVWDKPGTIKLEVAVSDKPGVARFLVAGDLYGSSLLLAEHVSDTIDVPVTTLDIIARENNLVGRGMIKVDVQFAEYLVIQGGLETITNNIDIMIIEVTLATTTVHQARPVLSMLEFANRLRKLGFIIIDVVGAWRDPKTGECIQLDLAFARLGIERMLPLPA